MSIQFSKIAEWHAAELFEFLPVFLTVDGILGTIGSEVAIRWQIVYLSKYFQYNIQGFPLRTRVVYHAKIVMTSIRCA